jgi:DNA topoisomerase-1
MPKKYSTTMTLIIVESPAKCKKIEQYLGPGYKCLASFGHIRELPSLKNINIENNYEANYTIVDNAIKKKQIDLLKKEIKAADEVILATDDDREGEAISWHICDLFKLDINKTKRIIFHEITETAIKNAIKNPRTIHMDMVHAQQARQILDILIGFKVSPILWKCMAKNKDNSLSAGRCQTPALKLIYDNYQEINNSLSKRVYNTVGYFTNSNLAFELNKQYETEDELTDFLDGSIDFNHIYTCSKPVKSIKKSPEPFTTSKLQQRASNDFHYSPKETMKICQSLYEAGYITYMRTDSKVYSKEFIETAKSYITNTYEAKYISPNIEALTMSGDQINNKKTQKTKNQVQPQEAHEAIRPTTVSLLNLPEDMDNKEKKMYRLIWENTLESCMADACYNSITASISAFEDNIFTYKSEQVEFPGWKIITKKYDIENKEYHYLQTIKQNALIPYKKMTTKFSMKGTKQHYTEARLVQLLEEKGIGRPSTFSSLVDKIQERGYVKKQDVPGVEMVCNEYELENKEIFEIETKREFGNEKGKLVIQPLGILVIEFLDKYFDEIFNYDYTKNMEDELDKIAKGVMVWQDTCRSCDYKVNNLIQNLSEKGLDAKLEIQLDENNTYLVGKYGPVIKCIEEKDGKETITFKPIKNDIDISRLKNGEYNVDEVVNNDKKTNSRYILGKHEGNDVILRKGKFGLYITWGDNSKTLKELGNRPIENITFDEVKKYLEEGSNQIRDITKDISIRKGPKGDYLFYKSSKMKKPQFYDIKCFVNETKEDYKICDISILKSWIKDKYNI